MIIPLPTPALVRGIFSRWVGNKRVVKALKSLALLVYFPFVARKQGSVDLTLCR